MKTEANYGDIPWKHWQILIRILQKLIHIQGVENLALGELCKASYEISINMIIEYS